MRKAGLVLAAVLSLAAGPGLADDDPAMTARRAAQLLERAGAALDDARGARDRVAALTRAVQAYEEGMIALREGLRRAAIREQSLRAVLTARREEIAQLLGILATLEQDPETLLLLHPSGPLGTARSGMLLGEVTPVLQAEAEALRADLDEIILLRALQQSAADTLSDGLQGVQDARTRLSQAMAERTDLPRRFAADPARMRALVQGAETLEGFASGLNSFTVAGVEAPEAAGFVQGQNLPLPVQGTVLRSYDQPDAAGVQRPGLVLATAPLALVTTPVAATIRYRGPLLDYGNVIILEPSADTLLVLAGLAEVYGDTGQVLSAGVPVGLMGGADPDVEAFLTAAAKGGGAHRPETLYLEIRQGNVPVDPSPWFGLTKD